MDSIDNLRGLLHSLPAGRIADTRAIEDALAGAWHDLTCAGRDGAMTASKISGRLENLTWAPPVLSFQIERHGGTVNGSSRAELQRWEVNLEQRTREWVSSGRRQLYAMAKRWDHKPIAKELAAHIRQGKEHKGLRWTKAGKVGISRKIMPLAVKETMAARSKRLRRAIGEELGDPDWQEKTWREM